MLLLLIEVACFEATTRGEEATEEIKLTPMSEAEVGIDQLHAYGKVALKMTWEGKNMWRHASTDHWVLHYQREDGIKRVATELEFYVQYIAEMLGARPQDYAERGHAYLFVTDSQWEDFCSNPEVKCEFAGSFANSGNLYLWIRASQRLGGIRSSTLAHEVSHAVLMRLFPKDHIESWLNEGLADYMSTRAVAAAQGAPPPKLLRLPGNGDLPAEVLAKLNPFPAASHYRLKKYGSGEQFVRFLLDGHPREKFRSFLKSTGSGWTFEQAVLDCYGDTYADLDAFQRAYQEFKAR